MFNFMSKTITPLYFRGYLYLWIGMVAVGIATMMQMTARGYLDYELTNSASKLTYVNVAFAFPMLSLSLFGGALSDRLDKQKIIQIGQFSAALLAFIIAALIFSDYINWLHLVDLDVDLPFQSSFFFSTTGIKFLSIVSKIFI